MFFCSRFGFTEQVVYSACVRIDYLKTIHPPEQLHGRILPFILNLYTRTAKRFWVI